MMLFLEVHYTLPYKLAVWICGSLFQESSCWFACLASNTWFSYICGFWDFNSIVYVCGFYYWCISTSFDFQIFSMLFFHYIVSVYKISKILLIILHPYVIGKLC
ncbi:unnamed protein product [Lupinus luteus]|uniref:Uncharacterized protein n=1 Tax=Lupinus luteus TaxID=3873 RepID=A0AAV1WVG6_LUPLU